MFKKKLVIFNLSTDLDDYLLAHTHDWIEEFAEHFEEIWVYSTRIGHTSLPESVRLTEIGGGGFVQRARALLRLGRSLGLMAKFRGEVIVFHHMSSKTVGLLAWPLKALKIPQGVWYSHPHADCSLRFGIKAIDVAFAPKQSAFPVASMVDYFVETGHGILFPPFSFSDVLQRKEEVLKNFREKKHEVVISVIGRVAQVKNIENLFHAIETLEPWHRKRIKVRIIGPSENRKTLDTLQELALNLKVKFEYLGVLTGDNLWNQIFMSTFIYNGTELSIDKSALIASSIGTPVLSDNIELLDLTGVKEFAVCENVFTPVANQIKRGISISEDDLVELMRITYIGTRTKNNIENTIRIISHELNQIANNKSHKLKR